jgi:hypothetical protein
MNLTLTCLTSVYWISQRLRFDERHSDCSQIHILDFSVYLDEAIIQSYPELEPAEVRRTSVSLLSHAYIEFSDCSHTSLLDFSGPEVRRTSL